MAGARPLAAATSDARKFYVRRRASALAALPARPEDFDAATWARLVAGRLITVLQATGQLVPFSSGTRVRSHAGMHRHVDALVQRTVLEARLAAATYSTA